MSKSNAAIKALADAIESDMSLRKQVLDCGLLFSELPFATVEALTERLTQQQYSAHQATADAVRIDADSAGSNGAQDLIRILLTVLYEASDLAKALWACGTTLETATADQACYVKKYLEYEGGDVALLETSSNEYLVNSQVRRAG